GVLSQELVDLALLLLAPADQRVGKGLGVGIDRVARPELVAVRRRILGPMLVQLIQELERDFPRLTPFSHVVSRSARTPPSRARRARLPRRGCPPRRRSAPGPGPRSAR